MTKKKIFTLARLSEVAAKAFCEQPFRDVSVTKIAAEAHCSTTTIYQIYGSKEALFIEAMRHGASGLVAPTVTPAGDGSLSGLLAYAVKRIEFLSSPPTLGYLEADLREVETYKRILSDSMLSQQLNLHALVDEVRECIEGGALRPGDARATAYLIYVGLGFDLISRRLLTSDNVKVDKMRVIEMVFTPLAADRGAQELKAFIEEHSTGETTPAAVFPWLYDLI